MAALRPELSERQKLRVLRKGTVALPDKHHPVYAWQQQEWNCVGDRGCKMLVQAKWKNLAHLGLGKTGLTKLGLALLRSGAGTWPGECGKTATLLSIYVRMTAGRWQQNWEARIQNHEGSVRQLRKDILRQPVHRLIPQSFACSSLLVIMRDIVYFNRSHFITLCSELCLPRKSSTLGSKSGPWSVMASKNKQVWLTPATLPSVITISLRTEGHRRFSHGIYRQRHWPAPGKHCSRRIVCHQHS